MEHSGPIRDYGNIGANHPLKRGVPGPRAQMELSAWRVPD